MIKFENTEVIGWEAAIRGMRNPMNSWEQSDSGICLDTIGCHSCRADRNHCRSRMENKEFVVGYDDMNLMTRLRNAGTDHRKFMRMITVYVDITAPLYWWKEFDTYKVGTVANSCSTMHKIHENEFKLEDFSHEHLIDEPIYAHDGLDSDEERIFSTGLLNDTIFCLNVFRKKFLETKDKKYWWQMIQLLPSSYSQRRTVMLNYEVLANIYKSRNNHKLDEWSVGFMDWIKSLPYSELITGKEA